MQEKVRRFLEQHHMIEKGELVAVGVSGGADSVCLLRILDELRLPMDFQLLAIHVEHGIRGDESLRDQHFVEKICSRMGIPLIIRSVDAPAQAAGTHRTLEEAARELRYRCFMEICEEKHAAKIAVAHHGDDCAETVLFHMSRGTGIRGLCGIPPMRALGDSVTVIRPLLCVTRQEIEEWLDGMGQTYCTDSTNLDREYARNRIRYNVIPELREVNDGAVRHIVQNAAMLGQLCAFLDGQTKTAREHCVAMTEDQRIRINVNAFNDLDPFLQQSLVHDLLGEAAGTRKDLTSEHILAVTGLASASVGRRIDLPYGMQAEKTYDTLLIFRADPEEKNSDTTEKQDPVALPCDGTTVSFGGIRITATVENFEGNYQQISGKTYTKCFDYDKIKDTVWIRYREIGDYFQVNSDGGHKKLKDYLIDEKVPKQKRDSIPLLAEGNHILWAVGYRISEACKVDMGTKKILRVQVKGGMEYDE